MPKHHVRGPRHSSTHPRSHAHASIHNPPHQPNTTNHTPNKRRRINPHHVYTAHDSDRVVVGRGGRDRRYDWDSQERYEYELPDQFVDEEVDEEEAFDDAEEDKYADILETIAARQRGGSGGRGQKGGRYRTVQKRGEEEEKEEAAEGEEADADDGGVNEDDEMDEGMTTLSAMLDEADDAEDEDEQTTKQTSKQPRKHETTQPSKPTTAVERMMDRVRRQMQATEEDADMEDEEMDEDEDEVEVEGDALEEEEEEEKIDANEEDEEDEEAEGDEFAVEDGADEGEAENDEAELEPHRRTPRPTDAENEDDEDGDKDEDEDANSASKRAHLLSMIEQLGEVTGADDRPWRRKERPAVPTDEAVVEESEYAAIRMPTGVAGTATTTASSKLTLADLMQSLQGTASTTSTDSSAPKAGESKRSLAQLKKKLSVLTSKSTSASTATLAEPLADIRQDEITRRLGYTRVKEELERWTPIVERHRDATNLHFPLHAPTIAKATAETMAGAFKPTVKSELEIDLERIMREYGVKERRVGAGSGSLVEGVEDSELKGRELTEEEMERRRAELAKLKSLLFHHELKQRRINKIKSKTYRRLRKKLKEKSQLTPEELLILDPEEADRRRLKAEVERVRERMTLAHTNRSAWMKRQMRVNANVQSGEVKEALEHSQLIAQRLRRKIDSADATQYSDSDQSAEDEEEDVEEDDADEGEMDGRQVQGSKVAQLKAALRSVEEEGSDEEKVREYIGFDRPPAAAQDTNKAKAATGSGNKSGLLGLKFMQRAMEEKRQQTREAREQLEDELKDELKREVGGTSDDEDDGVDERNHTKGAVTQQHEVKGKRKLGGAESGLAARRDELLDGAEREEKSVLLPHSFQSASVGMSRGKRARVGATIDVDANGGDVDGNEQLFEVEAFEDDGQQAVTAQTAQRAVFITPASGPSAENPPASKLQQVKISVRSDGRYRRQQQPAKPQPFENGSEVDATGDDNPWAQRTDVAGRKALREEEQKKRRRKRHKSNTTLDSDTQSGMAAASAAVQLDVTSVLLSAGHTSAVDEEQQRLVAAAFAVGEDEEKQFADTKGAAISAAMPTVEQFTTTLPGWGNWTGEGMQPRPPTARQHREQRETQRKLLAAQQLALNSRRDSALPHVIVSEQSDKRASKYLLQRLPFPYTSVDAYEQSLLQPLGKEWNAVEAHQNAVRPAVTITKGAIIEAVTYHESDKERREVERKDEDKRQRDKQHNGKPPKEKNKKSTETNGKTVGKSTERRGPHMSKRHKSTK